MAEVLKDFPELTMEVDGKVGPATHGPPRPTAY